MSYKKKLEKTLSIATYILSSVATIVINKYVLSVLNVKMQFMFLGLQSSVIVAIITLGCVLRIVDITRLCLRTLIHWFPLSMCLTLMVYTGSRSIEYLPISVFTLFKNGSIVLNALFEQRFHGKKINTTTWASFALMFLSSYIGDSSEFSSTLFGYLWMALNVVSTSLYIILIKAHMDDGESKTDPVFYCNLLSLPQFFLCSLLLDNFSADATKVNSRLAALIFLSGASACTTAYTTAWCLVLLSSTGLCVAGALNKLLVSFSGIVVIGERNRGVLKVASLVLGSLAGLMYSVK